MLTPRSRAEYKLPLSYQIPKFLFVHNLFGHVADYWQFELLA